jgi:hypothetical protein
LHTKSKKERDREKEKVRQRKKNLGGEEKGRKSRNMCIDICNTDEMCR